MDKSGLFEIDIDGVSVVSNLYHVPKSRYVHKLDDISSRPAPLQTSEAYQQNQYGNKLYFHHDILKQCQKLDDFSTMSETTLKEHQVLEAPIDCLNEPEASEYQVLEAPIDCLNQAEASEYQVLEAPIDCLNEPEASEYQVLEAPIDCLNEPEASEYQVLEAPIDCLNQPEASEEDLYCPILLTPEVTIKARKSTKKKNTPYLLKEDLITTKPMIPVAFVMSGARQDQFIEVSMRYSENPNQNKPVNVCKEHQDCEICKDNQRNHPKNFNFCINQPEKFSCQYILKDGHPTALLTLTDDVISEDGQATFNIIFPCLNSCKTHRMSGKKLHLILKIFDSYQKQLNDPIQYTVRVCKNVKRDHVGFDELPRDQEKLDIPQALFQEHKSPKSDAVILPETSDLQTLDEAILSLFQEALQTRETGAIYPVTIQVQESSRKKNIPYLLKEDFITTKPVTPVTFVMSGARQDQFIEVSMRYSENPNQNKPVNVCKEHQDCEICKDNQRNHPENFNFCIYQPEKFSCQYNLMDGHPTALLTLTDDVISEDGQVTFNIIFPCLNSCNIHRSYGKKLHLILKIFDREKNQIGNPIQFQVRVCKNVKRDHVDDEHPRANKRIKNSIKEEVVSNKNIEIAGVALHGEGPNNNASGTQEQELPNWTCFLMKSLDHQKQVVSMIKELQGEVFSFDDPVMTLG
ncbi:uncharacterized protein LOC125030945 isoform X2 [Penaeus chinensis]|uniref:uncharacterized protein LOC125030945 isoform X2 n=1 Tax=Penaeus chinensis TaxID=139456 RepID=UPI001FB6F359|nr:uncharacterized protein LOC125030945 isoform X2 [Penaeus chinensis]